MSIKNFRKLSRFLESLFKVMSICLGLGLVALLVGSVLSLFGKINISTSLLEMTGTRVEGLEIFSLNKGNLDEQTKYLALCFSGIILRSAQAYAFWQGGILFSILKISNQPFSKRFYDILRKVGLVLIVSDILSPLVYYVSASIMMTEGYTFTLLTFTSQSLIGLILIYIAEVIRYGNTLQKFTNDVV